MTEKIQIWVKTNDEEAHDVDIVAYLTALTEKMHGVIEQE